MPQTRLSFVGRGAVYVLTAAALGVLGWILFIRISQGGDSQQALHLPAFAAPGEPTVVHASHKRMMHLTNWDPVRREVVRDSNTVDEEEEICTETVLEGTGPRPLRYQRVYEKAVRATRSFVTARSYQGRTVLFELRDDRYHATVDAGPPLAPEDQAELVKKANGGRTGDLAALFVTAAPVHVGDHWHIDPQLLAAAFTEDETIDMRYSGGEATLTRMYKQDGRRYGVLQANLHLGLSRVLSVRFDRNPAQVQATAIVEGALDGSEPPRKAKIRGTIQGRGEDAGGEPTVQVMVNSSAEEERCSEGERAGIVEKLGQASIEPSAGWRERTAPDGSFCVRLPGRLLETLETDPTDHTWPRLAVETPQFVYEVSYTDDVKGLSSATAEKTLKELAGKKARDARDGRPLRLGKHPGLELTGEVAPNGTAMTATYRLYVVGARVYFLMAAQARGKENAVEAARFLDSFALTGKVN